MRLGTILIQVINFTTPTGFTGSRTPPLISLQIKENSSPFLIKHHPTDKD